MRHHPTLVRMVIIQKQMKKTKKPDVAEAVEEKIFRTLRMQTNRIIMEHSMQIPQKIKNRSII